MPIHGRRSDRGPVVFGKLEVGSLRNGDNLCIMPQNLPVKVAQLYDSKDQALDCALPGEDVKVELCDLEDLKGFYDGTVLC